jgi:hypothetical protein
MVSPPPSSLPDPGREDGEERCLLDCYEEKWVSQSLCTGPARYRIRAGKMGKNDVYWIAMKKSGCPSLGRKVGVPVF